MDYTDKPCNDDIRGKIMTRKFESKEIVIATHNQGKVKEISALLGPYVDTFISAGELGLPEPEENGATFRENAIIKARAAAAGSGKAALADDSGLAVTVLGGAPGVYSARWAGPEKDFQKAMQKVHEEMGDTQDRSAAFICVLALAWPDGHLEIFEGRVDGEIVWPPRGGNGFGYDPVFVAKGQKITFGEMDPTKKHEISHRADAFKKLVAACFTRKIAVGA